MEALSSFWEKTESVPTVMWKGRWINERSLHFYLQEALVHSPLDQVTERTGDRLVALAGVFDRLFPLE